MEKIAIITSGSLTASNKVNKSDIVFRDIDYSINFSDTSYNNSELSQKDLFDTITQKKEIPKTSQPSYTEIYNILKKRLENFDNLIIIAPSQHLSGSFQGIQSVVNDLENELKEKKCYCIEAPCIALCEAHIIEIILAKIEDNENIENIIKEIDHNIKGLTYAFSSDVEFLKLSGRVSSIKALTLSIFNIRPVVLMNPYEKPILADKGRGFKFILKYIDKKILSEDKLPKRVFFSNMSLIEEEYQSVINLLQSKNIDFEIIEDAPAVVATHFGPRSFGLYIF